jgi:hypothetical protein
MRMNEIHGIPFQASTSFNVIFGRWGGLTIICFSLTTAKPRSDTKPDNMKDRIPTSGSDPFQAYSSFFPNNRQG